MNWLHLAMLFAPVIMLAIAGWACETDQFDRISDRLGLPCGEDDWVN
jgi:hypothetical protein